MVNVSILGGKGHEEFVDLSVEEAEDLIEKTIDGQGERYFIIDKATQKLIREVKLQEGQDIALIPIVRGG